DGEHRHRLARTAFAHDGQHLTGFDMKVDAGHRDEGAEGDGQVFDFEQRTHFQLLFSRGSSASRSPSPQRLMARTVTRIARPGKVTTHQARMMNSRASASIVPHSGVGGCAPSPRKPSAAASRMAVENDSVACTVSGARQL